MSSGSLTIVGTGYLPGGHATAESLAYLENADKILYLVASPATKLWLEQLNPSAEDLHTCYAPGKPRRQSYREMLDRMLESVRSGQRTCAAFYGHPGVFVAPSHDAIRIARQEGFPARMLPGISAEDCLFADLGFDPALDGCHSFEATDFLANRRSFDPRSHLILWQSGAIGITTYEDTNLWSRSGLGVLMERLLEDYPRQHLITVYEARSIPICEPVIDSIPLDQLAKATVSVTSTLYVPPREKARPDPDMLTRLGLPQPTNQD